MACAVDHLVITAPTLAAGANHLRERLGVAPQAGGEHPQMGTHNLLLRLGEATHPEVIAVDPAAPRPGRERGFGLDDVGGADLPRLATRVARSTDIRAAHAAAAEPLGTIETMRRGDLEWQITVPADGRPVLDGIAPAIMEWPAGRHPADRLVEVGCRLRGLEFCHSDAARVSRLLQRLGCTDTLGVTALPPGVPPCLLARIGTPSGPRVLGGPDEQRIDRAR